MSDIYKSVLLDHFHNPRFKTDMDDQFIKQRGSNPRCGDEVEVGVRLEATEDLGLQVRFRGRGCSVCLASASIMTSCCNGHDRVYLESFCDSTLAWLQNETDHVPAGQDIAALDAVRNHSARTKCVLLAWQALKLVLEDPKLVRK